MKSHLQSVPRKQQVLLDCIPMVPDVQSAWLLLLHCASARANFQLKVVRPSTVEKFARTHDAGLWQCFSTLLRIDPSQWESTVQEATTLPMSLGGLGLRSALRTKVAAFWSSWSDCSPMIQARHPAVATELVRQLEGFSTSPTLQKASTSSRELTGIAGFEPPTWREMAKGSRGPERELEATRGVVQSPPIFPRDGSVPQHERGIRALVRSQEGTGGGVALSTCPTCRLTRFDAQVFRVLLTRRLQMLLPLTARNCRCGHFLDVFGHHGAACARAGVLSNRGFALESARICREAGGRVTTNVLERDLDFEGPRQADARRLEVAVDGLPLFGGALVAVDATIVSTLRGDGTAEEARLRSTVSL